MYWGYMGPILVLVYEFDTGCPQKEVKTAQNAPILL